MARRTSIAESQANAGKRRIVVLELRFPDRTLRIAEDHLGAPWADGTPLQFYAGLRLSSGFASTVARLGAGGGSVPLSVDLTVATERFDVSDLVGTDRFPHAATAELSALWPTQDWADRLILLSGARVENMVYGEGNAPIRITVTRDDQAQSAQIGDDTVTASSAYSGLATHDGALRAGVPLPTVIGEVYDIPAYKAMAQAPNDFLLIAGHRIYTSQVVALEEDGDGNTVSTADYTTAPQINTRGGVVVAEVKAPFGTWDPDGTTHPGTITASLPGGSILRGNRPVKGGADVLRYLLEQSGVAVDWRRMETTLRRLQGWPIGIYLSNQADAVEVIRDRLVSCLPLVEQSSEEGLWYAWGAPWQESPRATLIEGQHWHRTSDVRFSPLSEVRNAATVRYGYHHYHETFLEAVTVDHTNSGLSSWSKSVFGHRPLEEPIECLVTWDEATAWSMARYAAHRRAVPSRTLSGVLEREFYWLDAGDVVLLTSDDVNLSSRLAYIREKPLNVPGVVTFETIERLPTDRP